MPVELTPNQAQAYASGRAAPAHLDFLGAMSFRTVAAAVRLGIIAALADGPATGTEVAERAGTDPEATELLLGTLAAFGHLTRLGEPAAYGLTEGARHLLPGSSSYALVVEFWMDNLQHLWDTLEDSIRTGRPAGDFYAWLERDAPQRERFQAMLARIAGALAPELVERLDCRGGSRLLDVGAGHGAYAAAFLCAVPDARATLLDLPGALEQARRTGTDAGVLERMELRPYDLAVAPAISGGPHELALVLSVLHGFAAEQNVRLLRRVHDALAPGGRIAIVEQLLGVAGASPSDEAFLRLFSLNLFHGQGGRVWGYETIAGWLTEAGFTDIAESELAASPTDQLITASRR